MDVAESCNPRVKEGLTSQGFYVAGADGTCYGFNNNRTVDRVREFMNAALSSYAGKPPKDVRIGEPVRGDCGPLPPKGAAVIDVYARIVPLPDGASAANRAVGRDTLWIETEELRAMAACDGDMELPAALAARIARFHLVDNVRGEPDMWKPADVRRARFVLRPRDAERGLFALHGDFELRRGDDSRGMIGTISGEAAFDKARERLTTFRAHAKATAWGAGTWTPDPPAGRFPMEFAFVLRDDDSRALVAPQAAACGEEYRRPDARR